MPKFQKFYSGFKCRHEWNENKTGILEKVCFGTIDLDFKFELRIIFQTSFIIILILLL